MEINLLKKPLFWLVLLLFLLWTAIFSLPDNKLHLIFCDVGQGDAILISYHQTQVLIDGGPDNRVLSCLSAHLPFWDRQVEMVVLTHPEADHFGGLIDVIKRYSVKYFVSSNSIKTTPAFQELQQQILQKKVLTYSLQEGGEIKIGLLDFLVLWPRKDFYDSELNNHSLVLKLVFNHFTALLTGDLSSKFENQLDLTPIEVLKIAHHGSQTSTSQNFLEKVKPKLSIISVGVNKFGQPSPEILNRLNNLKIRISRTDQNGEIEIVSDGRRWYTKAHDSRPN